MTGIRLRTATAQEVALMLDWAAEEGWNPGLDDAPAFHAADPEGFFVADIDGSPVAAISIVNHSDIFAFLGLYLCRPEYRGQGIGFALWQHGLQHAGGRVVGLDGVPDQEANYVRSGFTLTGRTRRFGGRLAAEPLTMPLAQAEDGATLARLDREATGISRPRFLKAWTQNTATRKTVVLRDGDAIIGFATARLCREGCKIGPIIAPDDATTHHLAAQAAAAVDAEAVFIDVPEKSAAFAGALESRGFEEVFRTARMYRGEAPEDQATLKAVATLELG